MVSVSIIIGTVAIRIYSMERNVTDDLKVIISGVDSGALLYGMFSGNTLSSFSGVMCQEMHS